LLPTHRQFIKQVFDTKRKEIEQTETNDTANLEFRIDRGILTKAEELKGQLGYINTPGVGKQVKPVEESKTSN